MSIESAIDRCIQCGFCLQACPTYRLFETEESSPRGRIARVKDVLAGEIAPSSESLATFSECLGCRACETACPSGVHYEEILMYGREQLKQVEGPVPRPLGMLLRVIAHPSRIRRAKALWRRLGPRAIRLARGLPLRRPEVRLLAALPDPAPQALSRQEQPEVAIHRGCLMDVFWEGTNARAAILLRQAGLRADLMSESAGCCGALHAHQGDLEEARVQARRVIEAFEASGARVIASLAGGCGAHLKEYPVLFRGDSAWEGRAQRLADAVQDVATLLAERGREPSASTHRMTYQDSCHLRNGLKVTKEPRQLLRGQNYCEMASAGECCGSAGVYNLLRPDVAGELLRRKVAEVREMAVDEVVTANPGCELQWRMGAREAGLPLRVRHLVDHLYDERGQA
ncbi:MAG: (Fe-S)-binding protein [Thermaerobacter sp.]|nr:(Fe-S)-binding protein [Thermaerobacter sp.]